VCSSDLAVLALVLLFGLIAAVAVGCGSSSTSNLPAGVMAQVGKVSITEDQFNTRVADFEAEYAGQIPDKTSDPSGYKDFQRSVLDYMVTYEMVQQQAAALKISVSDAEVQAQIDQIKTDSFSGDQSAFDAALKAQNTTLDQLKASYRESLLLQKAYDEVTKSLTDSAVTQSEIQSYYDAHKTDYYTDETRTARHILIAPVKPAAASTDSTTSSSDTTTTAAPTDAQWAAALATAQKVRADLVAGADWKTEAAKYSDDTGTKDSGGDLGSISKGEMVAEFDTAVFSLAVNEISQPIKTVYGYHIIQVESITPAKQSTVDEVKTDITSTLLSAKKDAMWQDWVTKTRAADKVVILSGMEVTTTTTAAGSSTTAPSDSSTAAGGTATTVIPSSTDTSSIPASTTTSGVATTTTAASTTTTATK
jgi:foldase protein PrsA